jgi:hypothetical protein
VKKSQTKSGKRGKVSLSLGHYQLRTAAGRVCETEQDLGTNEGDKGPGLLICLDPEGNNRQ